MPSIAAVVSVSTPADPRLLVRETFRMADLPIPAPVAGPLAWLTARVYARPRGHAYDDVSATVAASRYRGPILLVQGDQDSLLPLGHLRRLEEAALAARRSAGDSAAGDADQAPVEVMVVPGGRHSFLFEDPGYRRAVAAFLATHLDGPEAPSEAADVAAALPLERIPEPEDEFGAVASRPRGLRLAGELIGLRPPRDLKDEA
jgi:pimeloyl-ACP methyl ester carboxylesterase